MDLRQRKRIYANLCHYVSSGTYGVEKRQDRIAQMRVVKTASNGTRKVCSHCSYHNRDVALKLADTCI
ncbi:hypothetical protein LSAT2_010902 [Lamellibrachia satsuma]|nr:hypothetical protein LSAT2_010902 [Lamellibrachia satsuma]